MMSQYIALSRSTYGCWVAAAIDDGDEFVASHTSGCKIVFMGGGGLLGSRPEDDRAALAAELGFAEQADLDEAHARVAELEAEVAALKQPVHQLPNNSTPHNWTWGELITYLEKARRAGRLIGWQIKYSYAFKEPACVLFLSGGLDKLAFSCGDACESVKEAVTWLVQHEQKKQEHL